jgi:hypothetical protein
MAMLQHLYETNYKTHHLQDEARDTAEFHLPVFMLGDKYDIESLGEEASESFKNFLEIERLTDCMWNETIYTLQKLLGPNAPQLADQTLAKIATRFVLGNLSLLWSEKLFRELIAEGTMFKKDPAVEYLEDLNPGI